MKGSYVRSALERLANSQKAEVAQMVFEPVTERIVVRRAQLRASCEELERRILSTLQSPTESESASTPGMDHAAVDFKSMDLEGMDCGARRAIPADSALRIFRKTWDSVLKSWIFHVRCVDSRDCVPFIVEARQSREIRNPSPVDGHTTALVQKSVPQNPSAMRLRERSRLSVHRGQSVRLVWTEDDIRVTVTALCLEAGSEGQTIKARILPRGRIVRATVSSDGILRTSS